jgi:hypothetical protein
MTALAWRWPGGGGDRVVLSAPPAALRRADRTPAPRLETEQAMLIVTTWLRSHPTDLHIRASVLVLAAFKEGFPC